MYIRVRVYVHLEPSHELAIMGECRQSTCVVPASAVADADLALASALVGADLALASALAGADGVGILRARAQAIVTTVIAFSIAATVLRAIVIVEGVSLLPELITLAPPTTRPLLPSIADFVLRFLRLARREIRWATLDRE